MNDKGFNNSSEMEQSQLEHSSYAFKVFVYTLYFVICMTMKISKYKAHTLYKQVIYIYICNVLMKYI